MWYTLLFFKKSLSISIFTDNSLQLIYENAKKTNDNALLNEYLDEQNAMFNQNRNYTEYDKLLKNRYTAQGRKDLDELNSKNVEVINLLGDLIKVTQQQNIAVDNMQKVMKNLEEKKYFEVNEKVKKKLKKFFVSGSCSNKDSLKTVRKTLDDT